MKKATAFIITITMMAATATASAAKSGDIAGDYYSTDIRTYLNGVEVDSINIGGRTLINAEDMKYYSFYVDYNNDERRLSIIRTEHASNGAPPEVKKTNSAAGKPIGKYYHTDIVTTLDGKPITAYNTGGITYVLAEEMRDFGYDVIWNENERTLTVNSSVINSYSYSIGLSQGTRPETDGIGSFEIRYDNGKVTGTDDAILFGSSLSYQQFEYSINMGFYQNLGLFFASELMEKFDSLTYEAYGTKFFEPETMYDEIAKHITIKVNGTAAEHIKITRYGGNGHSDYSLTFDGLPKLRKDEIKTIEFSLDPRPDAEPFTIERTESEYLQPYKIYETIRQNPLDWVDTTYMLDNHWIISVCESPSLGVVEKKLYIADKTENKVIGELLSQVRQLEGYKTGQLKSFAYADGGDGKTFLFSVYSDEKTGDFYADLADGTVHLIVDHYR